MPSRILREGINSSARILALSPMAELFYRRLMTVVDDYGRFYAAPSTIRGACWPTCPNRATERQIAGWLEECCQGSRPLIEVYEVDGAQYLEMSGFDQKKRFKSKYPDRLAVTLPAQYVHDTVAIPSHDDRNVNVSTPVVLRISNCVSRIAESSTASTKKQPTKFPYESLHEAQDWEQHASEKYGWPKGRVVREFERCRNHYEATGKRMVDWLATWRNWCLKGEEMNPSNPHIPEPLPKIEPWVDTLKLELQAKGEWPE